MKSKGVKIVLIVFLSFLVIALICNMVFVMVNKDKDYSISFFAFGNKTKVLLEEEYNINDVKDIDVNASSSNVKFIEGSSDLVKVTVYGKEGENVTSNLNNQKLEISKDNNRFFIIAFFVYCRDEIIVELPRSYNGDIGIHVTSGNVEVLDLDKSNLQIEASSGNISCGNMLNGIIKGTSGNVSVGNGNDINIRLSSGNIRAGNVSIGSFTTTSGSISVGEIKDAKINVSSGSIRVDRAERITAEATSGGIIIKQVNGFCDLSCKSGGVKIDKCFLNENSSIKTTSGGIVVKETNDIYIDAKTTSGGIKIEKNNRTANYELKIEATSGGVKVNV